VAVNDPFFAWVFGFGKKMTIVSPSAVVEKYKQKLEDIRSRYE
jgi:predicted DNA-binding transcriptional regulator YafY